MGDDGPGEEYGSGGAKFGGDGLLGEDILLKSAGFIDWFTGGLGWY